MTQRALKKVTTYIIRNSEWVIVYADHFNGDTKNKFHYAGIRREWITDGKINRELNGLQMMVGETAQEVIDRITDSEEINYIIETTGMDTTEACLAYFKKKMNIA